jgi:hypothetical protein
VDGTGKGVAGQQWGDGRIQLIDQAHAAAQNNRVGVHGVDDLGQGAGQTAHITAPTGQGLWFALSHGCNDFGRLTNLPGLGRMIGGKTGATQPGFQASVLATPAVAAGLVEGRNLTDELIYGGFNAPLQSGTVGAYTNEGQTYGVTVRARY